MLESLKDIDTNFIDLKNVFCNSETCSQFDENGRPLYSDTNHVNELGEELIIK